MKEKEMGPAPKTPPGAARHGSFGRVSRVRATTLKGFRIREAGNRGDLSRVPAGPSSKSGSLGAEHGSGSGIEGMPKPQGVNEARLNGQPPAEGSSCPCLHYREQRPQPPAQKQLRKWRYWECIDCGETAILPGSVFLWVAASYGKWRRKK